MRESAGVLPLSLRIQYLDISKIREFEAKMGIQSVMIEGVIPSACIFYKFITCIKLDLELYLYENHKMELVKLPVGKGSLDFRIEYAINEGRRAQPYIC